MVVLERIYCRSRLSLIKFVQVNNQSIHPSQIRIYQVQMQQQLPVIVLFPSRGRWYPMWLQSCHHLGPFLQYIESHWLWHLSLKLQLTYPPIRCPQLQQCISHVFVNDVQDQRLSQLQGSTSDDMRAICWGYPISTPVLTCQGSNFSSMTLISTTSEEKRNNKVRISVHAYYARRHRKL